MPSDETIGIGRVSVAALKLIVENTRVRRQFVRRRKLTLALSMKPLRENSLELSTLGSF